MDNDTASEPDYSLIFEKLRDPSMVLDPSLRVVSVTDSYLDILGLHRNEIMGQSILDIFSQDTVHVRDEVRQQLAQSFQSVHLNKNPHETDIFKCKFSRSEPENELLSNFYWKFMNTPILNSDNELIYFLHQAIDISRQEIFEEKSRTDHSILEAAIESSTDAVFITDTEGNITIYNEAFATYHRFSTKEECAKTLTEFSGFFDVYLDTGEIAPLDMWAVQRALRGETVVDAEYILHRKDTGERWTGSYNFAPIYNEKGTIVGSIVIARDITKKKEIENELLEKNISLMASYEEIAAGEEELREQYVAIAKAEQDLRETKDYLEKLITYANVPIIIWDSEFKITRINHAFEHLIGRNANEVVGKPLWDLLPPDQIEQTIRLIKTTREGVRWETAEIHILHADGTERALLWNSASLYGPDDETPYATIAQGHDITEEKRLEKEKDSALAQIKQNFAQLAILNDGIRNPLTIITLLIDDFEDQTVVDKILEQVKKIDNMVNQLDIRWMQSENVLGYLRRHHQVQIDSLSEKPDSKLIRDPETSRAEFSIPHLMEEIQAQLYTILNSIDALIYVSDIETHEILFINKVGRSRFGDVIGKKCYSCLQKDLNKPCSFCTNHLLIDETGPTGVYRWEYHNTLINRWYDCRDRAIRWTNGRLVRLEIATDITEQKQYEENIQRSEEKFSAAFSINPDPVAITEIHSGKIIEVNPAFISWSGYSLDELIGKTTLDLHFWESNEQRDEIFSQIDDHKDILDRDVTLRIKSGDLRYCLFSARHIMIGGEIFIFKQVHDVTTRVLMERKIMGSEAHLEQAQKLAHLGSWTYNLYSGDIVWTDETFRIFGRDKDLKEPDINGLIALFHPDDQNDFSTTLVRAWENKTSFEKEWRIVRPNGEIRTTIILGQVLLKNEVTQGLWGTILDITERKRVEEILKENEKRLGLTLDVTRMGTWELNLINHTATRNFRHDEIFGYDSPLPEWTYEMFLTYVFPEDREYVDQAFQSAVSQQKDWEFDCRIQRIDGEKAWIMARGMGEYDPDGQPRRMIGIVQDITERKKIEEILKDNEKRLTLTLDVTGVGTWELDLVNHTATRNARHAEIFGYETPLPDWSFEKFLSHVIPEDREQVEKTFRLLITNKQDWEIECRIQRVNGELAWILARGVREFDKDGKPIRIIGIVQDITERKRAILQTQNLLTSVRREQEKITALLNSIADEVWYADKNGKFTLINPAGIREFGIDEKGDVDIESLARKLEVYRPDGTPRPVDEAPPLRALNGELIKLEEEIIRIPVSGELRYRQVSSSPVMDEEGNIIGSVSVVRDITDKKIAGPC